jgi:hypothetical protein
VDHTTRIRAFAECRRRLGVGFFVAAGTKKMSSAALGKENFAERGTRQSPTLGKELVYRVQDTRHSEALGKDCFAERQTLGKEGARHRAVSGRLQLTSVRLCRGPKSDTR